MPFSLILTLIIRNENLPYFTFLIRHANLLILNLIIRNANLPYSCLNYPACNSPLFLPEFCGMPISLIIALIIRHANLPYSYLNYPA